MKLTEVFRKVPDKKGSRKSTPETIIATILGDGNGTSINKFGKRELQKLGKDKIQEREWKWMLDNFGMFDEVPDIQDMLIRILINEGEYPLIFGNFNQLRGRQDLQEKSIDAMAKEGLWGNIFKNLDKISGTEEYIVNKMIIARSSGRYYGLIDSIEDYLYDEKGLSKESIKIVMEYLGLARGETERTTEFLKNFGNVELDEDTAIRCLEQLSYKYEETNPGKENYMKNGTLKYIIKNLKPSKIQHYDRLVLAFINVGEGGEVLLENIEETYPQINLKNLLEQLRQSARDGRRDAVQAIAKNVKKFPGEDPELLAYEIIKLWRHTVSMRPPKTHPILENLSNFPQSCHKNIIKKLIEEEGGYYIRIEIDNICQLDEEIAEMLKDKGYGDIVEQYPEKFGLKKEK